MKQRYALLDDIHDKEKISILFAQRGGKHGAMQVKIGTFMDIISLVLLSQ